MKIALNLGNATEFKLTQAILVYSEQSRSSLNEGCSNGATRIVATAHDVDINGAGVPTLLPGTAVKAENVQQLAISLLQQSGGMQPIHPRLIALGIRGMAWHCPASRRQLWFKPQGESPMHKLSGETFPQPDLLFVAGHRADLAVYAVRGRPTLKSGVYYAPYWNLSEEGGLCIGTARMPKEINPSAIERYEEAFFKSNFTHSNLHGRRLTSLRGGHDALWARLKGKRHFPGETLVRIGRKTVADLIR